MEHFSIVCIYHEENVYNEVYVEHDHFLAIYNKAREHKINRIQFKDLAGLQFYTLAR